MRRIEIPSPSYTIRNVHMISEQEIIKLQDTFLTTGIHSITVASIEEGRTLITKFMHALNCYHSIACLKNNNLELDSSLFDVYKTLSEYGEITNHSIFTLFLDQFTSDFLFIETTKTLMQKPWYENFLQQLAEFKLHQTIPVICLSYVQQKN